MRATSFIFTIDLMLLKPYFHGTTSRSGAPFWLGMTRPYMPTARIASGCIASSRRRPSRYGQSSTLRFWPGICCSSTSVSNATYFASEVGAKRFSTSASGIPTHGITIDHASTQRSR